MRAVFGHAQEIPQIIPKQSLTILAKEINLPLLRVEVAACASLIGGEILTFLPYEPIPLLGFGLLGGHAHKPCALGVKKTDLLSFGVVDELLEVIFYRAVVGEIIHIKRLRGEKSPSNKGASGDSRGCGDGGEPCLHAA